MDYKNGKIYKIIDNAYTKMYIGSTTQPLSKRFSYHKKDYIKWKNNKHNKVMVFDIFDEFGVDNCKIELIENYECNCKNELERKEGEYIQNNNCVNKKIAGRTKQEYCKINKDKIAEHRKIYRETNRDKIAEYYKTNIDKFTEHNKEYYQANKDKIKEYQETNKDKIAEHKKKYYQTNKDKIKVKQQANKDKMKEYYQANKDKINARRRELRAIKKANKEVIIE
jgi:hypothetical protein